MKVIQPGGAEITPEEAIKENKTCFRRQPAEPHQGYQSPADVIKQARQISQPEQDAGQDENRHHLKKIPLQPGVGLNEDVGELGQPQWRYLHIKAGFLTWNNFSS